MQISFLCTDHLHPVNKHLERWISTNKIKHRLEIARTKNQLSGGDILFLVSCSEIITALERSAYRFTLVLHASDLPLGRGWSPHIWQIIEGSEAITVSLLEAEDKVDTGKIWRKLKIHVPKHALWQEINEILFNAEMELIDFAVKECDRMCPTPQDSNVVPSYYPRRTPDDSEIDPCQSIFSQFNKIRVCDPLRYPAFFKIHEKKYKIIIEQVDW